VYTPETLCVAIARLGREDQKIVCATLAELASGCEGLDMGPPLHSLVIVGDTHPVEDEILEAMFRWRPAAAQAS
jgi:diphthine synthase